MYRDTNDGRNNVHWAYNGHGNIKPLSGNKRAIALLVVVSLAAIVLVVLERVS